MARNNHHSNLKKDSVVIRENNICIVTERFKTQKGNEVPHWIVNPPNNKLLVGFWEGPEEEFDDKIINSALIDLSEKLKKSDKDIEKEIGIDLYYMNHSKQMILKAIKTDADKISTIWYICNISKIDFVRINKYDKFDQFIRIARHYAGKDKKENISKQEKQRGRDPHYRHDIYSTIRADSIIGVSDDIREKMNNGEQIEENNPPIKIEIDPVNKEKINIIEEEQPKSKKKRKNIEVEEINENEATSENASEVPNEEPVMEIIEPEVVKTESPEEIASTTKVEEEPVVVIPQKKDEKETSLVQPMIAIRSTNQKASEAFFHIAANLKTFMNNEEEALTILKLIFGDNTVEGFVIERMWKSKATTSSRKPQEITYYSDFNISSFRRVVSREINKRGL